MENRPQHDIDDSCDLEFDEAYHERWERIDREIYEAWRAAGYLADVETRQARLPETIARLEALSDKFQSSWGSYR